ncbi:hypothetical protein NEAUS06_1761 [Nematocida ausubeli]|nr:hypothetical protein NEAUS06_1761 [Nematocida ausubeli]
MIGISNGSLRVILTGIAGIIGIACMTVMGMYLFSSKEDESIHQPHAERQGSSGQKGFYASKHVRSTLKTFEQNGSSIEYNELDYTTRSSKLKNEQELPQGDERKVTDQSSSCNRVYLSAQNGDYKKEAFVGQKENNDDSVYSTDAAFESSNISQISTPSRRRDPVVQVVEEISSKTSNDTRNPSSDTRNPSSDTRNPPSNTTELSSDTMEEYTSCHSTERVPPHNLKITNLFTYLDNAEKYNQNNNYLKKAIEKWYPTILHRNSASGCSLNDNLSKGIKIGNTLPYRKKPLSTNDKTKIIDILCKLPDVDMNSSQNGYKVLNAIMSFGSNFVERKSNIDYLAKMLEVRDSKDFSAEELKVFGSSKNIDKITMLRELLRKSEVYFPKTYESYKDSEEFNNDCSYIEYTVGDVLIDNMQYFELDSEMNNDNLFKILETNANGKDSLIAAIMLIFSIPEIRSDLTFVNVFFKAVNETIFQNINQTDLNEKLKQIIELRSFEVNVSSFLDIFMSLACIVGAEYSNENDIANNLPAILSRIENTISTKNACLAYEHLVFVMRVVYTIIPHYIFGVKMRGKQIFRLPSCSLSIANIKVEKTNDTEKYKLENFKVCGASSYISISRTPNNFNPDGFNLELTDHDISTVSLPYFSVIFVDNREHRRKPLYLPYSEIFYNLESTKECISRVYNLDIENIHIFFYSIANKTWSSYEHVYTTDNSTHNGYVPVFYYIEIPNGVDLDKYSLLMITKEDKDQTDDSVIALPLFLNLLYQDILEEELDDLPTFTNDHIVTGLNFKDAAPCNFEFKVKNPHLDSRRVYKGLSFKINTDVELEIPSTMDLDHVFVYNTSTMSIIDPENLDTRKLFFFTVPIQDKYANFYFGVNENVLNAFSYRNSSIYTPFASISYSRKYTNCSLSLVKKSENDEGYIYQSLFSSRPTENPTTDGKEDTTENENTLIDSSLLIRADSYDILYDSFLLSCLLARLVYLD